MKISILAVGQLKGALLEVYNDYARRIHKKHVFSTQEINIRHVTEEATVNRLENMKLQTILQKNYAQSFIVALDLSGRPINSLDFAKFFTQRRMSGRDLLFLLGGSDGLNQELLQLATEKFAFSKLTFPHQLFRVMLAEQIYRALSIVDGEPYHK